MDKKNLIGGVAGGLKGAIGLLTGNAKAAVLLPVLLVIIGLTVALNQALLKNEANNFDHRFVDDSKFVSSYYQRSINSSVTRLSAYIDIFRNDESLQPMLRNQDRAAMLNRTQVTFDKLKERYNLSHLFFNTPTRANIVRAHSPDLFGDVIDRTAILLAEKTGKPATGLELNPAGQISMRVVTGMYDRAGLAGYIEMGESFDQILKVDDIKNMTGMEAVLVLDKGYLEQKNWEADMKRLGFAAEWDAISSFVVARQTRHIPPTVLAHTINGTIAGGAFTVSNFDNQQFYSDAIAILDVGGRSIGYLIVLRSTDTYISDTDVTAIYYSMGCAAAAAILLMLLYMALRKQDVRFVLAKKQIEKAELDKLAFERECDAIHEQYMREMETERSKFMEELELERSQLQQSQVSLQQNARDLSLAAVVFENSSEGIMITDPETKIVRVNKTFTDITGYTEMEVLGKTPKILKSGRHNEEFYQQMWASLLEHGNWQGEVWNCRKPGDIYPEWLSLSVIRDENKKTTHYLGVFSDLTEKKMAEARNHHLFNYDNLTNLPNRHMLEDALRHELAEAQRHQWAVAVLHLNLDRFKTIIDTLGHPFGDKVLRSVAERLAATVRDSDTLARFSGDEFAVVLADVGNAQNASMVAQKVLDALSIPYVLDGQEVYLSASVGIAMYPSDADNGDDLIRCANVAARHVREEGGNAYNFYIDEMNAAAEQRLTLENSLRRALDNGEFALYYQPLVDLQSGSICGMEALLRWQHPNRGIVFPDEYISVLEETGLIVPVGEWVLQTACTQIKEWQEAGLNVPRIAVNLSARQFRQNDLLKSIYAMLEDFVLEPAQLGLEITESVLLQDIPAAITVINQLSELGIEIAIDDFGTGYSSLSYLKRLPISKIKIDRTFIKDIGAAGDDGTIAKAVISLGHNLNMQVVAEGVETADQLDYLYQNGCDVIQGFYFSRPIPADEMAKMLRKGVTLDSVANQEPVEWGGGH